MRSDETGYDRLRFEIDDVSSSFDPIANIMSTSALFEDLKLHHIRVPQ